VGGLVANEFEWISGYRARLSQRGETSRTGFEYSLSDEAWWVRDHRRFDSYDVEAQCRRHNSVSHPELRRVRASSGKLDLDEVEGRMPCRR
jgi:hypothetical protein